MKGITYQHDGEEFAPAQIVAGVQLLKGKVFAYWTDNKATRTVVPVIVHTPRGEMRGFYSCGGLPKVKQFVIRLVSLDGVRIVDGVCVLDGATFSQLMDEGGEHFKEWRADGTWDAIGMNDYRFNYATRRYEYTPKGAK